MDGSLRSGLRPRCRTKSKNGNAGGRFERFGRKPDAGCRTPAAIPNWSVRGRYPGSQVLIRRLPGLVAQWLCDGPALAYRCGGS